MRQTLYLAQEGSPRLPGGWQFSRIQDISILLKPGKLFDENTVSNDGDVPVVNQSADAYHGYHDEEPGVYASEQEPVSTFANHTCAMRLMKRPFSCIQNIFPRIGKPGVCDTTFFHYATLGRVTLSGYKGHHPIYRQSWIPFPPLSEQSRIASILSAYDDLIENNRRRMKLLEEAARQLYREWFVRLRFPGHERVKIKDGLPEGWERKTAYDAVEILSGGTPKTTSPDFWDGEIPFYTPKDAVPGVWVTGCERTITEAGLNNCNSRLYPKGTVFISARGTVGKLNMAQQPMAMSQSCYALVGMNSISQPFVFFAMLEGVEALRQQAVGAVFDAIIVDTFKRIPFVVPDARMRGLFDEMADPILAQVENLTLQSQKLRAARDLLLPKLMSGEVAV